MPYRIDLPPLTDGAFDDLVALGALDVEMRWQGGTAAIMPDGITPEQISAALGVTAVRVTPAVARDAGSVWVLRPRPLQVRTLRIVPADHEPELGSIRLIDAPAFGTGLHATTSLCLEAIHDAVGPSPPRAILDVGTGSGVLSLAALHLGVQRAVGLDVDGHAVNVAAANARLNGFERQFHVVRGGPAAIAGAWPLVVANLVTGILIELAPELVRRVGHRGQLLISGLRSSTAREVEDAYCRRGMERAVESMRDGWVALLLRASW